MSGASYGSICGVLYVNKWHQTVRCFSRGHDRYGGRCRAHEPPGRLVGGRFVCGWQRSDAALPCQNSVHLEGRRCHIHASVAVQVREERWRLECEEKLGRKVKQLGRVEREIGALRAEIERLGGGVEREAAE
jgi:hypothetical protein